MINASAIALNLGYGYLGSNYTYLLASISAPNSYAVDPTWVDANGGVQFGAVNTYLATNTMGTGPYLLQNYNGVGGGGYTLTPNPKYWGAPAAKAEPWNINLPPANTTVDVIFQDAIDITTNDLLTGAVQRRSFAYVGPSTIQQLTGHSNVDVQALPTVYGATSGSWWIYLNSERVSRSTTSPYARPSPTRSTTSRSSRRRSEATRSSGSARCHPPTRTTTT